MLHVTAWKATLEVGEDQAGSIVLDADAASLRVHEGTGGMQALGDDDKASIEETIDDEVLKRQAIAFRSTSVAVAADGGTIGVEGELTLVGETRPIAFELTVDGGRLRAAPSSSRATGGSRPTRRCSARSRSSTRSRSCSTPSCRRAEPRQPL